MSGIHRFEDLQAWQKARLLTKDIYSCCRIGEFAKDFGLKDQIRRASVATMSNIAEGFDRGGDKEFYQFLSNAKGSCGEVKSDLYVALDVGYISSANFDHLYGSADEIGRLIYGFMNYLRQSPLRGRKFRPN